MPDEQVWVADNGPQLDDDEDDPWSVANCDDDPDEDEASYGPSDDDAWWDTAGYEREEPNCYRCDDIGCRRCQPSRLRLRWWGIRYRLRFHPLRRRRPLGPDEPPF